MQGRERILQHDRYRRKQWRTFFLAKSFFFLSNFFSGVQFSNQTPGASGAQTDVAIMCDSQRYGCGSGRIVPKCP